MEQKSILKVAIFYLPVAWELRWSSESGDQMAGHLKMATKSLDSDTVWACIFLFKACIATQNVPLVYIVVAYMFIS